MKNFILTTIITVVIALTGIGLFWLLVMRGTLYVAEGNVVTVVGSAKTQVTNQIASFTAGVSAVNDNRETAVGSVNTTMEKLITQVKAFGIEEKDIQTSNISIYQEEEQQTIDGRSRTRPGAWRVSNNITVTLRDISRASELTQLLTDNGATNVFGPNFMVDDATTVEEELLQQALEDARSKAGILAKSSSRRLGKVLTVSETGAAMPLFAREAGLGGGGGIPIEPGAQTVEKSITVTFELH